MRNGGHGGNTLHLGGMSKVFAALRSAVAKQLTPDEPGAESGKASFDLGGHPKQPRKVKDVLPGGPANFGGSHSPHIGNGAGGRS